MEIQIPLHLLQFFGPYGAQVTDSASGEVVGWGYQVLTPGGQKAGEELWKQMESLGKMTYVNRRPPEVGSWHLITQTLSAEEALAKFGPVTNEEIGPRGGWKSITYGNTKFTNKLMKPIQAAPTALDFFNNTKS